VRNTCYELLRLGVVPIINENDSLTVAHMANFGDNDTMAAMTAVLLQADWVFLATDVDFLYTANPKDDPRACPIYTVEDIAQLRLSGLEASSSQWGTGGMATKLIAARIAVAAGVHCGLVNGAEPERIGQMVRGTREGGTHFVADTPLQGDHNHWILTLPTAGSLTLDRKGYKAVLGRQDIRIDMILTATGSFQEDEAVALFFDGKEIARALVRMPSSGIDATLKDKDASTSGNGLRDFSRELQAAGVYLKDYNSWRKGGHKGAQGEVNAEQLRELEKKKKQAWQQEEQSEQVQIMGSTVAWPADVALIAMTAIRDADAQASTISTSKSDGNLLRSASKTRS
jgi:hypothetical protein